MFLMIHLVPHFDKYFLLCAVFSTPVSKFIGLWSFAKWESSISAVIINRLTKMCNEKGVTGRDISPWSHHLMLQLSQLPVWVVSCELWSAFSCSSSFFNPIFVSNRGSQWAADENNAVILQLFQIFFSITFIRSPQNCIFPYLPHM